MKQHLAIKILLAFIIAITVFHLCILTKVIPYDIAWGGRLKSDAEMYVFETLSLMLNALFGLTLLIKGDFIKPIISIKAVNIILWVFLILFGLNTIGNVFAKTNFEKLFSIVTLGFSILIWVILKTKDNGRRQT